ncbi:thioredoxin fold domain-containing protein [Accumulibacter sp.]|uniref:thioredoxin fold domain-containing protein n=1 Tax=Accumulibacter sp. TaxID=2053492 RepID=UPI0025DEC3A0|nr:thioredoxin fold domain-containing protein [Accumulibacter sp.]MCM8594777.1 thioredoxin fold domain-containing protein [Accumulibacter sp.]MCM8625118.1 thioredoxin fold domain-containing protein [Accumulibacter sp.]MDS4048922.1 thioredoxin fold domain-containing protein [Accumulibacter sp.]
MRILRSSTVAALFLLTAAGALAEGAWKPDVARAQAALEKETGVPLRAGFRIEPTVFAGYYALRSGAPGGPVAYFRDDMVWTGNLRAPGWTVRSAAENSPEGRIQWLRERVGQVPLDRLVFVRRTSRPAVIIWSAPDCPFCRRLEAFLEQQGVSAYVAPVGLSEDGFRQAAAAYCSREPGRAWTEAMHGRPVSGAPRPSCAYPRELLGDIGFFFGQGRVATPIVVFADGSTISGWDDQKGPARLREKLAQGVFFPAPGAAAVK